MNARKGVETIVVGHLKRPFRERGKTMNARKGVETSSAPTFRRWPWYRRGKTMNARKGVETYRRSTRPCSRPTCGKTMNARKGVETSPRDTGRTRHPGVERP